MAFSKKDRDFLKGLPGETRFLDEAQTKPLKENQSNRVYYTNSKGFRKDVNANDLQELSHGLKKGAENFNSNAETRKFVATVEGTDDYKWVDSKSREIMDRIREAMDRFPEELKLRADIIEAYLEDNKPKMDELLDKLKKLDAEPIKHD